MKTVNFRRLDTELRGKNKTEAVRSLAVPALRYSFAIVNWHQEYLQNLDRKTMKLLTIHGQNHIQTDVDCLHFHRKQGRRVLMQLEEGYAVEV